MTSLVRTYRLRLDQALRDLGRDEEAAGRYDCQPCGAVRVFAALMVDVRDREEFGGASFVCETCASDLIRQETAEAEELERQRLAALGKVDEETMNGLRAARNQRLGPTDWIEASAAKERVGPERTAALLAYRAACHHVVDHARDTGEALPFPDPPE